MKYSLDSSVGLKWVLKEPDSSVAVRLRDSFQHGSHELIAPDIFPVEVAHAIAKAERRGLIQVGDGSQKLADVFAIMPTLHTAVPLLARAFAIASAARHGVYDCLYIALAEREGCELVTADGVLVKKFQAQFPFIIPLSALP